MVLNRPKSKRKCKAYRRQMTLVTHPAVAIIKCRYLTQTTMPRTARDFEELYFLVQDETYAPRAKKGDVIVADPNAAIAVGDDVIAAYPDGQVLYALVLARCDDGAINVRTPGGDCYRLVPGQLTRAQVTSITSVFAST